MFPKHRHWSVVSSGLRGTMSLASTATVPHTDSSRCPCPLNSPPQPQLHLPLPPPSCYRIHSGKVLELGLFFGDWELYSELLLVHHHDGRTAFSPLFAKGGILSLATITFSVKAQKSSKNYNQRRNNVTQGLREGY